MYKIYNLNITYVIVFIETGLQIAKSRFFFYILRLVKNAVADLDVIQGGRGIFENLNLLKSSLSLISAAKN